MRNYLIAWTLLMSVMLALFTTACSNRVETANEEAARAIPDLSGIWEAPIDLPPGGKAVSDVCGEPACANLLKKLGEPPLAYAVTVDEPQMLPWAEEKYTAAREGLPEAVPVGREEKHPYFSGCATLGPSALTLAFFNAVEIRQFPDVVFLFFGGIAGEADHAVRRIYLDGRGWDQQLQRQPLD